LKKTGATSVTPGTVRRTLAAVSDAPPCDPALLEQAVAFARRAGEFTLPFFRSAELAVERKADDTPVTDADRGAERLLRELLEAAFPEDEIVGEEEATRAGTSGRTWIIDPIDGTKAFTHGVPLYSTLLAAVDEHGPLLGVICLPALPETVWAGRGLGCHLDGVLCHVSPHDTVTGAYVTASALRNWPEGALDATHAAGAFVRTWGDAYGYVLVATGRVEAMVDHQAAVWDLAPMPVIIGEAGGRFTDLAGVDTHEGGSGLATNGTLHDELLGLLNP
jgi:histidinol phosphatase-like enzyme (inositol monophosphatase family)